MSIRLHVQLMVALQHPLLISTWYFVVSHIGHNTPTHVSWNLHAQACMIQAVHQDLVPRVPLYQTLPLYLPIIPAAWPTYTPKLQLMNVPSFPVTGQKASPVFFFRNPCALSVSVPAVQLLFHKDWFMGHHFSGKIFQIPQTITLFFLNVPSMSRAHFHHGHTSIVL